MQLEVELHALEKETDTASKVRLVEVKKELNDLRVITKEHAVRFLFLMMLCMMN
ncbi:hypothetical protein Hdeb2414_s0003g00113171 [Helianthus debilis subsp. tardiflorus]